MKRIQFPLTARPLNQSADGTFQAVSRSMELQLTRISTRAVSAAGAGEAESADDAADELSAAGEAESADDAVCAAGAAPVYELSAAEARVCLRKVSPAAVPAQAGSFAVSPAEAAWVCLLRVFPAEGRRTRRSRSARRPDRDFFSCCGSFLCSGHMEYSTC